MANTKVPVPAKNAYSAILAALERLGQETLQLAPGDETAQAIHGSWTIAGITLVSGTLTYYPANNPGAVATILASTTGTGQIGIFISVGHKGITT